jgi:hypothetical protein
MMKLFVLLFGVTSLCGCDAIAASTEAKACDAYYEGVFATDLNFPLWSAEHMDEPISFDSLKEKYYSGHLSELEKLQLAMWENQSLAIRTVYTKAEKPEFIQGVGLNGLACEFLLIDGEVYQKDSLVDDARARASTKKLRELAQSLGDDGLTSALGKPRERAGCCLP